MAILIAHTHYVHQQDKHVDILLITYHIVDRKIYHNKYHYSTLCYLHHLLINQAYTFNSRIYMMT